MRRREACRSVSRPPRRVGNDVKALTIRQPWASLVALGVKTIETRPWSTKYRGLLAIHAAVRAPDVIRLGYWWCEPTWGAEAGLLNEAGQPHRLPLGAVVATSSLVDVLPIHEHGCRCHHDVGMYVLIGRSQFGMIVGLFEAPSGAGVEHPVWSASHLDVLDESHPRQQAPYGDFRCGRFAWLLDDIKPTTERCPACWGSGFDDAHKWGDLTRGPDYIMCRQHGDVGWGGHGLCSTCKGADVCDPVPARGRQGLWEWTP